MKRAIFGIFAAAVLAASAMPAAAKDYMVTGAKPNKLFVVDLEGRKVEKSFEIPGPGIAPGTIATDGKIAYVVTNHMESVSGIDLDSGKEVFRADFSTPQVRTKGMFAMDLSPDGKELAVFQSPVKLGLGEYQIQDTRIAIYDTSEGIGAKPKRVFEAPRRIAILAWAKDGKTLYALGWDLYGFDPQTGKIKSTTKLLNWDRKNYSPPDILDVWPQFEQANVFSTPYFAMRTNVPPTDPSAYKTGLLTLDLETGKTQIQDFENTEVVIFSSVVNPANKNELFSVYTQLSKIDNTPGKGKLVKRIELPHTYYAINISSDAKELYVAGTMCDIGVHSTETLDRLATIELPGCPDMGVTPARIIKR